MATLKNDRNQLLYTASSRVTGASVTISSGVASTIVFPKNSTNPVPTALTITANTTGYAAPSFTWSYRFGITGTFTAIAGNTSSVSVNLDSSFYTAAAANNTIQYKVAVAETSGILGINQSEYTLSLPILREGADGINSVVVRIYKRTSTGIAPTLDYIAGTNTTYSFPNSTIVGHPTGWTQLIPDASTGSYLWYSEVVAASITNSYVFSNSLWPAAKLYSKDGAPGNNTAFISAYKRTATTPVDNPGTVAFDFTTGTISTTTLANSWLKTMPAGSDPLYVTTAVAVGNSTTDTVADTEWSTPVKFVENGLNSAILYLYARNNNSSTAPTLATTGTAIYTFSTGVLSGTIPAGWSQGIPADTSGSVLWVTQASAISNAATDSIQNTEWATARVLASKGADGVSGAAGVRGSRQLYSSDVNYSSTYVYLANAAGATSYAVKATDLIAAAVAGSIPTNPIEGDTVTFSNGSTYIYTITYKGSAWTTPGTVVDGNLLVTGSVTASKINSNGLSIRDASGNIILAAGTGIDWTKLGTTGAGNLVRKSIFADGSIGSWYNALSSPVAAATGGISSAYGEIRVTERDNYESGGFPVIPGETIYCAADVNSSGNTYGGSIGLAFINSLGNIFNWVGITYPASTGYTRYSGSIAVPNGSVKAVPWIQISSGNGVIVPYVAVSNIYIGRAMESATVGAPNGTYVGGTLAQNVESQSGAQIKANAAQAAAEAAASAGLANKLSKAGDTITGRISMQVTDGIFAGSDTNNGVYFGNQGLVGKKGGNTTFAVGTDGSAVFSGNIGASRFMTGAYSGYSWPATGQYGSYLGPEGLLLGNANNSKYFQVGSDGNVYAPGMKIEEGTLTINQVSVIDTLQIAGNAVTVPISATTTSILSFYTDVSELTEWELQSISFTSTGSPVSLFTSFVFQGGSGSNATQLINRRVRIYRNSILIHEILLDPTLSYDVPVVICADTPAAGSTTYRLVCAGSKSGTSSSGGFSSRTIVALETKR